MIVLQYLVGFFATIVGILQMLLISLVPAFDVYVLGLFGAKQGHRFYSGAIRWWTSSLVWYAGLRVKVEGAENLPTDRAFIMMVNHSSLLDIPVSFYLIRKTRIHMRMLTKKELFRVPIWGAGMKASGFIPIDRKNTQEAIRSYDHVRAALASGISIWVSPEGGRTGGELKAFKKGPFITALEVQATIVPVAIIGLNKVLSNKSYVIKAFQPVRLIVGEPIEARDYTPDQREALMARVHSWFEGALAKG